MQSGAEEGKGPMRTTLPVGVSSCSSPWCSPFAQCLRRRRVLLLLCVALPVALFLTLCWLSVQSTRFLFLDWDVANLRVAS